ncbi:hypothetical protein JRO89_XS09G0000100 [Xanthoceras sorbifolium]|uniref:Ion transport domain-containing protein n=1 Tax=Xanthoceras sorbifolium TaxID=99658 RepID=A0ABQ8HJV2_9ROSI|nr:hypothetical protein JRO89_XS09G0000100 [Xanthoceras sorbifolium]
MVFCYDFLAVALKIMLSENCVLLSVIGETMTFASPHGLTFLSNGEWNKLLMSDEGKLGIDKVDALPITPACLHGSCFSIKENLNLWRDCHAGNSKVEQTDLADDDYLLFNFNDYPNGMVTLFNLLVMGNWHVWMQSYKELTGTWWTVTYFVSFYLITVLLLLNLVVAFVLEAFFAEIEMEVENSEKCEEEDQVGTC